MMPAPATLQTFPITQRNPSNELRDEFIPNLMEWEQSGSPSDCLVDTLYDLPVYESGRIDFSALLWSLDDDLHNVEDFETILQGLRDTVPHGYIASSSSSDTESSTSSFDRQSSPPPSPEIPATQNQDKLRLYEFVIKILVDKDESCARWISKEDGEFEITNTARIAARWGALKGNPSMTYEKFARALRHYYKLGILVNYEHKEKLRYKFSREILSTKF